MAGRGGIDLRRAGTEARRRERLRLARSLDPAAERLETAAARTAPANGRSGGGPGRQNSADAASAAVLSPLAESILDLLSRTTRYASEMLPPGYSPPVEE